MTLVAIYESIVYLPPSVPHSLPSSVPVYLRPSVPHSRRSRSSKSSESRHLRLVTLSCWWTLADGRFLPDVSAASRCSITDLSSSPEGLSNLDAPVVSNAGLLPGSNTGRHAPFAPAALVRGVPEGGGGASTFFSFSSSKKRAAR